VSRGKGREDVEHTITEDTAKVVTKKRGFCVDEVVLEDMSGGTNLTRHEAVILEKLQHMWMREWNRPIRAVYAYIKESLEPEDGTELGRPFSFRVVGVVFCDNCSKMTL